MSAKKSFSTIFLTFSSSLEFSANSPLYWVLDNSIKASDSKMPFKGVGQ